MRDFVGLRCRVVELVGLIVGEDGAAHTVDVMIDGTTRIQTFAVGQITLV